MRIRQLDILRGMAIVLVLGRHMPLRLDDVNALVGSLLLTWKRCGWIGVDLFFVLSGFLISGLLFREHQARGQIRLGRFLIRRGFKIYPSFYIYVAVLTLLAPWNDGPLLIKTVLSEVLFLQNYSYRFFEHSWSLAVEEHFYLALPLLLLYLSRRREGDDPFRPLVAAFGLVAVTLLVLRIVTAVRLPYSHLTHFYPTHLRFDSLLFGVLLSYFHHYRHEKVATIVRRGQWVGIVAATLLILPAVYLPPEHPFVHTAGFTCLYVGFGLILLISLHRTHPDRSGFETLGRGLAGIGLYSYSIYLWHIPVRQFGLGSLRMAVGGSLPYALEL
ncbi:MAG: acyltransferase family protein, partial [Planctomycetota bacterium]